METAYDRNPLAIIGLLPVRLHRIWRLSFDPVAGRTRYPQCARKSRVSILAENHLVVDVGCRGNQQVIVGGFL